VQQWLLKFEKALQKCNGKNVASTYPGRCDEQHISMGSFCNFLKTQLSTTDIPGYFT
jgi:hypothetical protein